MTNLPITSSAPQTVAASKQATSTSAGDTQDSQPFGDVLARQISDPTAKDVKADGKLAVDALAQRGIDAKTGKKEVIDDKKTDVVATDTSTTLPADMLAALLPQTINTAATTTTGAPGANARPDVTGADPVSSQGKRGTVAPKADASATVQTGVIPKAATSANPDVQAKEPAFAEALAGSANRTATAADTELTSVVREAISVAAQQANAAPQSNAAALASLQNAAANLAAPVMQPVQVTVNTPVNQDKWNDEFSQKITWLASSGKDQTAELHLNPPQLGPVDVVIKVSGDQATALFTSPHAAVRDAIEQAMPRLRDMMADNGIMLGNATVSDQAPRDQSQTNTQRTSSPSISNLQDATAAGNSAVRVSPISRHNGIVDTFA